jgi:hypothetical protein
MADDVPLNRPFLESITTAELLKLADSRGIDLPPGLDRTIVIEELLDTGDKQNPEADDVQTAPDSGCAKPEGKSAQPVTAPLPQYYNITYLEVLIRDPLWAFAFWEINAHDKEALEGTPDFEGYCLRVLRFDTHGGNFFTVQVGADDSAWYLGFPPEGGRFKVELCVIRKEVPVVLAVSKPFRVPNLPEPMEDTGNPLLRLSGIGDFNILRNTVRSSRLPKRPRE